MRSNQFVVSSFLILIGCDKDSFQISEHELEDRVAFDKAVFVNRGRACLDVSEAGKYSIEVTLTNSRLRSSLDSKTRTAVGTVRSNKFLIEISSL